MYKLGVILIVLSVIAIVVIGPLRAPVGWLLVPAGALAVWLVVRIVLAERAKREFAKEYPHLS